MSDYQDFYPTPTALIEKMLDGVNLEAIGAILEPSAGKGDICDFITDRTKYRSRKPQIDVIELDQNLQHILRGKGYNLIHDDFLTFHTHKCYDLIVANFPFSEGDAHLQQAIGMLERSGGSLVCLVNAETIRNPYTNLRQSVVAKLEQYGATIDYLEGEFDQAERRTNVEVALIRLVVEREPSESVLLDDLKKAEAYQSSGQTYTGLVASDFIKGMVQRFDLECRVGVKLIEEYRSLKPLMLDSLAKTEEEKKYARSIIKLEVGHASEYVGDHVNEYLRLLRRKYWSVLIRDDRFHKLYTSNVLKDLDAKLTELEGCDFSEFNIQKLIADLNQNITSGVEKAIIKMFDEFSGKHAWSEELSNGNIHYYNGWKSNKAHKINNKIVVPIDGFSAYKWDGDKLDTYRITERITDLVKAFNYLDGGLEGHSTSIVHLRVDGANRVGNFRNLDFHYFTATFFKKGTCHIVFKDQKLLDKLNIYGSQRKGWLPPSYGKKSYAAMTEEERSVIDDFQGEEAYNKVMVNSDYYLAEPSQLMLEAGA